MNNWNLIETGYSKFSYGYYFGNDSVYLLWKNRYNKLTSEESDLNSLIKKIQDFCDEGNLKNYSSKCTIIGRDFIEIRYYNKKKINFFYYLFFKKIKNEIISL